MEGTTHHSIRVIRTVCIPRPCFVRIFVCVMPLLIGPWGGKGRLSFWACSRWDVGKLSPAGGDKPSAF